MSQQQAAEPVSATTGGLPANEAIGTPSLPSLREVLDHWVIRLRKGDLGSLAVILGLVLIWITFQSLNGRFLSDDNLHNLARQVSYGGVISLGVVVVLLLGEVDLAVGSISGCGAAILAVLVQNYGWNSYLGIVATLLAGAALGTTQGVIVARMNVPSFIVTLGGLLVFLGLQLRLLGKTGTIRFPFNSTISQLEGRSISPVAGYVLAMIVVVTYAAFAVTVRHKRLRAGLSPSPAGFTVAKTILLAAALLVLVWEMNRAIGVPVALIIFLALAVVFWALITQTQFGQHVLAVGGNAEAARRAGINVDRIRIVVFAISGLMGAAGGVLSASYVGAASQDLGGNTLLLYCIAAAVIGGTSLFGGRGSAWSAVTGWLVIGSIYNGMYLLNLVSDLQYMVIGAVLIAAVIMDSVSRRRAKA